MAEKCGDFRNCLGAFRDLLPGLIPLLGAENLGDEGESFPSHFWGKRCPKKDPVGSREGLFFFLLIVFYSLVRLRSDHGMCFAVKHKGETRLPKEGGMFVFRSITTNITLAGVR